MEMLSVVIITEHKKIHHQTKNLELKVNYVKTTTHKPKLGITSVMTY